MPAEDRYGQQGEPGFATEDHDGPGHAGRVGAAQTLHQGGAAQRSRRDALLRALREHLPAARVQGIAAGLHLLITFPGLPDPDTDLAEAILRAGVLVHPLSWDRQRPGVPGIVLGYAVHTPDQLHEAARRIARVVNGRC
jgi:DNA-binding transcriptional MocR family regulator